MGFPRQESWNGLPFPSPGDLPGPGIKPGFPHGRQILYHLSYQRSLLVADNVYYLELTLAYLQNCSMNQIHSYLTLNNIFCRFRLHFVIHSSTDGHLGCFYLLAIVNNAAMADLAFSYLGYKPTSGIAGSYSCAIHTVFFTEFVPFYIPTSSTQGFYSFTSLSIFLFWFLEKSHLHGYKICKSYPLMAFNFYYLNLQLKWQYHQEERTLKSRSKYPT